MDSPSADWPFEMGWREGVSLAICFLVSLIANAVGIGGSQIFVPMAIVLLQFDIKGATALSMAIIFLGSLGTSWQGFLTPNPADPAQPLVDMEAALLLAPPLLAGVTLGVLLNTALPAWFITLAFIPILALVAWRVGRTGLRLWRRETVALKSQEQDQVHSAADSAEVGGMAQPDGGPVLDSAQPPGGGSPSRQAHLQHSGTMLGGSPLGSTPLGGSPLGSTPLGGSPLRGTPLGGSPAGGSPRGRPPGSPGPGGAAGFRRSDTSNSRARSFGRSLSLAAERRASEKWRQGSSRRQTLRRNVSHASQVASGTGSVFSHTLQLLTTGACNAAQLDMDEAVFLPPPSLSRPPSRAARPAMQKSLTLGTRGRHGARAELALPAPAASPPAKPLMRVGSAPPRLRGPDWDWRGLEEGQPARAAFRLSSTKEEEEEQELPSPADSKEEAESEAGAQAGEEAEDVPGRPAIPWWPLAAFMAVYAVYMGVELGGTAAGHCTVAWSVLLAVQLVVFGLLTAYIVRRADQAGREEEEEEVVQGSKAQGSKAQDKTRGSAPELGRSSLSGASDSAKSLDGRDAMGKENLTKRAIGNASSASLAASSIQGFGLGMLIGIALFTLFGGMVAALFGSGGGLIVVPLLLQLDVPIQSAAATSNLMVLVSSSAGAFSQLVAGNLNLQYAGVYGATSLVAGMLGTYLLRRLVDRLGRPSLLVLIFAGLMAAALALTIAFPGREAVQQLVDGEDLGFPAFCD